MLRLRSKKKEPIDLSGRDECPFCASTNNINQRLLHEGRYGYFVYCEECSATGPLADSIAEGRALWRLRKLTLARSS